MSKVIAHEISAGMFHWDIENNTFSQEASSLGESVSPMGQVWDDSCDQGFVLVSTKDKKNKVIYTFDGVDEHHGEVVGWRFSVFPDKAAHRMGMLETKVLIIND
jgi:hypothetical protein